ncbi:hypothetical protein [Metabacillus litoralis]|uniref:hypothetical protein n=1 Tax=Metabacillus TaxID=2675233 RepID=UPI001B8E3E98|nr:hypothetical protein [Metabacillus litoralis]MCM3164539.1 hypothetical protein [Metabacillus litoralis]
MMKDWAIKSAEKWRRMGLTPEVNRMMNVIKDCDRELQEIDLIERFREDENYDPPIQFKHKS